jgi:hypothetical protein
MKSKLLWPLVNGAALVVTILVNGLANALPLNGQLTGEISDRFRVYFVPAGYVFAIWGVIYLSLLGFVVYQFLPAQRDHPRLRRIGAWFALSCAANSAWLVLWHYEYFGMTVLVMLVLLASLIVIYLRLDIGRAPVSTLERWLVDVPFGIYLGWVTVATIANVTAALDYLKWDGWGIGAEAWTVIMLAVGAAVGAAMAFTRRDAAYLGVLVWAFAGIGVRQSASPLVATAAWAAAGLAGLWMVGALVWPRRAGPGAQAA